MRLFLKRAGLAALSGLLYVSCFPRIDLGFLACFFLIPLLIILRDCSRKAAFGWSFFGCYIGAYLLMSWVNNVGRFDPIVYISLLFLPVYFGIWWSLWGLWVNMLYRRCPGLVWLGAPALWVLLEYIRALGFLAFPWGQMGYSQHNNLLVIQSVSIFGMYGLGFVLIMLNVLILEWRTLRSKARLMTMVGSLAFIFIYGGYCLLRPLPDDPSAKPLKTSIIQARILQEDKLNYEMEITNLNVFIKETVKVAENDNYDLIIWSEAAISGTPKEEPFWLRYLRQTLWTRIPDDTYLFMGAHDSGDNGEHYNAAVLLTQNEGILDTYRKIRLLPFGEFIPFQNVIGMLVDKVVESPNDFSMGEESVVFKIERNPLVIGRDVRFGCMICFESVIPSLGRKLIKNGADFIVMITNDGWFGTNFGPYQHASVARFRAVENGCWVLRSANTGISQAIDPYGRIVGQIDLYERGNLPVEFSPVRRITVYSIIGDVFVLFILAGLIIISILAYKNPLQPADENRNVADNPNVEGRVPDAGRGAEADTGDGH